MEIREFQLNDVEDVKQVARKSLDESYGHTFDEATIDAAVEQWYGEDVIDELQSEERSLLIVADNDDVHGYAQGEVLADDTVVGDIHWLHVRPAERGEGVGSQLLGEIVDQMENDGADLVRGRVIEVNEDGADFYEKHGFQRSGSEPIEVDGDDYEELVYKKHFEERAETILEPVEGPEEQEYYIDYTDGETGVLAPLYPIYLDESRDEQYGWLCRNCGSTETTMGSRGRIECEHCDNARKSTRWDGSYL